MKARSEAAEGNINEAVREITQLETERVHLRQNSDQLSREIKNRSKQLEATSQGLQSQRQGMFDEMMDLLIVCACDCYMWLSGVFVRKCELSKCGGVFFSVNCWISNSTNCVVHLSFNNHVSPVLSFPSLPQQALRR